MLEKMTSLAPYAKTPEMKRLVERAQLLRAFGERQEEIEWARTSLEKHRHEFETLMEDDDDYLKRARAVFSEERFSMTAFSKEQVQGALDKAGYSASRMNDEHAAESLLAAILHLADKDTRTQLSVILLSSLPDYVAAGRMVDGWIVQHTAYLLLDSPKDSNVFLFEMFARGYDAMAEDKQKRANHFLKEFGMDSDRLKSMSIDELDTWTAQQSTPEAQAKIEAIFKAHPYQKSMSIDSIENMERDSATILEREDALPLLLSPEEMMPWLPKLQECFHNAMQTLPDGARFDTSDATSKVIADAVIPVLREMAGGIFTPERRNKFVAQLKAYRNERFAEGDKRVAGLTQSAMMLVEREDEPACNVFLIRLCFTSIRTANATTD